MDLISEYWEQLTAFVMLVYILSVMRVEIGVLKEKVAGFLNLDIIKQTKLPVLGNPTGFAPLFIPFPNPRVRRQ